MHRTTVGAAALAAVVSAGLTFAIQSDDAVLPLPQTHVVEAEPCPALAARAPEPLRELSPLVDENERLRAKLAQAQADLALLEERRRRHEGDARAFPSDVPPRFAEMTLQQAFDAALDEVGIEGGVIEVDCHEFPCVVYGQLSSKRDMDKLRAAAALAPYREDSHQTSLWHGKRAQTELAYFAVAFTPKRAAGDDDLVTRTDWRMQQRAQWLLSHN